MLKHHFDREIFGKRVAFRDLAANDVQSIVEYWHDSDPAFLRSLGADLTKLTSRANTRGRLIACINPTVGATKAYFVVEVETELVAYTNLNFRSESQACAHFHLLRRSPLTKGIIYLVFPEVIQYLFARFPLEKIEMQTLPENTNIDRLLRRFGLDSRRAFLEQPDGFARPGELNIWELHKASLSSMLFSR